ncbi:MAG: helix-turn-helix domain-containing protein [Jatrophihabitans sp.]
MPELSDPPTDAVSEPTKIDLNTDALKALTHPLRLRLLGRLRQGGPSTATKLGEAVGESSGATSYHLRQLARYGLVSEQPSAGRERWWRAVHELSNYELPAKPTEEDRIVGSAYLRVIADVYIDRIREITDRLAWLPKRWQSATQLSDRTLRLTARQAQDLGEEIGAVLDRWSQLTREPESKGAEDVSVQLQVLPQLSGRRR